MREIVHDRRIIWFQYAALASYLESSNRSYTILCSARATVSHLSRRESITEFALRTSLHVQEYGANTRYF